MDLVRPVDAWGMTLCWSATLTQLAGTTSLHRAGAESRIIEALARELRARDVGRDNLAAAFDAMIDAYEEQRPQIAAFGVTNAKPSRTKQIHNDLLKAQ